MCGEYWVSDPTLETKWAEEIIKICSFPSILPQSPLNSAGENMSNLTGIVDPNIS